MLWLLLLSEGWLMSKATGPGTGMWVPMSAGRAMQCCRVWCARICKDRKRCSRLVSHTTKDIYVVHTAAYTKVV
jgi:hypothetical protein